MNRRSLAVLWWILPVAAAASCGSTPAYPPELVGDTDAGPDEPRGAAADPGDSAAFPDSGPGPDAVSPDGDGNRWGDGGDGHAAADAQEGVDAADVGPAHRDAGRSGACVADADCGQVEVGACQVAACDVASGVCVLAPAPDGAGCDNGDACSATDVCLGGICVGTTLLACDDGNPCTDDGCDPALGCVTALNFAACDNGDPCTTGDSCKGGVCIGGPAACEDDDACTHDACDGVTGACHFTPQTGTPCDDGSACTGGDHCVAGLCEPGTADGCDDGNACTLDGCVDGVACDHAPLDGVSCEDGDACTLGETCQQGACAGAFMIACDDQDPCTVDTCTTEVGCVYTPTPGAACEDGDACTEDATCAADGACLPSSLLDCDDGNPCTKDTCHPINGCTYVVKIGPCEDGDACTAGDACLGLVCAGTPLQCDDGDACTVDSCDPLIGCQIVDVSSSCQDDDPCTDDGCAPGSGCVFTFNQSPCDDGDACSEADTCQQGTCAGASVGCDDADPCTVDACDHEEGCVHAPWVGPCEDGDACTEGEGCDVDGLCAGGLPLDPSDGLSCTLDACDSALGPTHSPDDSLCGVGQVCDPAAGCVTDDVRLIISKVLLWPTAAEPLDGDGQWIAVSNVGALAVDLRLLALRNAAGDVAALVPVAAPEAPLVLGPGATMAGAEPELIALDPGGFSFALGGAADGFLIDPSGDTLQLIDAAGQALDVLAFEPVTHGPAVPPGAYPIIPGEPTELAAAAVATANEATDNDIADQWCVRGEASAAPEGPHLVCSRIRLNELSLATTEAKRWVELHAPSGARFDGCLLHLVDGAGPSLGYVTVPSGRAPITVRTVLTDGLAAVDLPPMSDGSVQLVRIGELLDVYGFGAITADVDPTWGHPLFEVAPGPRQEPGVSAARVPDGSDTDDATVDWMQVLGGSPGKSNDVP